MFYVRQYHISVTIAAVGGRNNAVLQRSGFGGLDTFSVPASSSSYNRPVSILEGRLFKIGAQLDF